MRENARTTGECHRAEKGKACGTYIRLAFDGFVRGEGRRERSLILVILPTIGRGDRKVLGAQAVRSPGRWGKL